MKQIVSGSKVKASGTVANPESLDIYYKYFQLEEVLQGDIKAKL